MPGSLLLTNQQNKDSKESFFVSFLRRTSRRLSMSPATTKTMGTDGANTSLVAHDAKELNLPTSDAPTDLLHLDSFPTSPATSTGSNNNLNPFTTTNPFRQMHQHTPDSGYHSEQQQPRPASSSSSPLTANQSQSTEASTEAITSYFSTSSPSWAAASSTAMPSANTHHPRSATISAVSPPSMAAVEPRPKMSAGTMSRVTLQRTRTTDMLLSPTLTLARPSSVVLPPLPPITLNLPVSNNVLHVNTLFSFFFI